nr:MAG TPA: hypothetical protein [Caudoviricetes sp.]
MQFVDRVAMLAKEKGVTEKQVLLDCNLNKNLFGLWRRGSNPNKATQKILADYFGVSVEYLMGETDDRTQKNSPGQVTEAEGAKKAILDLIDGMSDDQLQKLETLIQAAKNVL